MGKTALAIARAAAARIDLLPATLGLSGRCPGSFSGFLLETLGPHRLRAFLADFRAPTRADPRMVLDPIAIRHLGGDFASLGEGWLEFLRNRVPYEPALVEGLRTRRFGGEPDRFEHCDFCFAPQRGPSPPNCCT